MNCASGTNDRLKRPLSLNLFTRSGDSCAGLVYHGPPFWKPSPDLYRGDGFFATRVKNRIIVMNKTAFDISTGDR